MKEQEGALKASGISFCVFVLQFEELLILREVNFFFKKQLL